MMLKEIRVPRGRSEDEAAKVVEEPAPGDGAEFKPFRFPVKMSEAFRLPWKHINDVDHDQLEMFYDATGLRKLPSYAFGSLKYLVYHYLLPNHQVIKSKGRHLLTIKIWEGSANQRQPRRRAIAWWMPLHDVRDPKRVGFCPGFNHLVETYDMDTSVGVAFDVVEREVSACCPFHIVSKSCQELLCDTIKREEDIAKLRGPEDMTSEMVKAEKRRQKRLKQKNAKKAQAAEARAAAAEEIRLAEMTEREERRNLLIKPDGVDMELLMNQMRKVHPGASNSQPMVEHESFPSRDESSSDASSD